MSGVRIEHWWVGLVVAGVAVFSAGGVAKEHSLVAVGLGLLLFGIGEWMNHPRQEHIAHGMGGRWKVWGHPRRPTFMGNAFSVVGCLLLLAGAVRVAISLFQ
ncbi:hypothetical protein [Brevundimonas naejangsanensis]|uniref:hypothetical protein n=1 Tax=Brevundimonas naejangsanensis TaxID=588932 RepID=UPI003D062787